MGREDHGRAVIGQCADHHLELALVDRIESAERLVENDQPRPMHQRSQQLYGLRHALGQLADLAIDGVTESVALEQFAAPGAPFGQGQTT